jgi:hypothetical protein
MDEIARMTPSFYYPHRDSRKATVMRFTPALAMSVALLALAVSLASACDGDDDDDDAETTTTAEASTPEPTPEEPSEPTAAVTAEPTAEIAGPFTAASCPASLADEVGLCDSLVALANALASGDEEAIAGLSAETTAQCPHEFLLDEQGELVCTEPPPDPLPVGYAINQGNEGYSQLLPLPQYTERIAGFIDNVDEAASDDRGAGALDVLLVEDCREEAPNLFVALHATAIVNHPEFGTDRVVFIPNVELVDGEWQVTFFGAYLLSAAEQFGVDLFAYRCPTADWL